MAKEKKLAVTNPQWTRPQFFVSLTVEGSDLRQQSERGATNTFPDMTRRVYASDEVVDYEAEWLKAIGE